MPDAFERNIAWMHGKSPANFRTSIIIRRGCRFFGSPVIEAVNKALSELQSAGTIAQLAQAAGLTYLAPREPIILGDVWRQVLNR